jgi:hypothetical protein
MLLLGLVSNWALLLGLVSNWTYLALFVLAPRASC